VAGVRRPGCSGSPGRHFCRSSSPAHHRTVSRPPEGLAQHAWYFFAIFAGVIVGLMLEPLPGAAIGLIGVVLVTVLAPYVLFGPPNWPRPASSPPTPA
jgi:di/tricarboxylate transporter